MTIRTPARYRFPNPATGFPMVLRLDGPQPIVERDPFTMAIEFKRDASDAERLTATVRACPSLLDAAQLLARECGCTDILDGADFDPTTEDEQAQIDTEAELGKALDHLLEAYHATPYDAVALQAQIKQLIKDTRAVLKE